MFNYKKIKKIHLYATLFFVVYYFFTSSIFIAIASQRNFLISLFGTIAFGIIPACIFLYFFNHEDFFKFAGIIEKEEKDSQNKFIKKYLKYGKYAASILVSQFGGPILLALFVRFLFKNPSDRYWVIIWSTTVTAIIGLTIVKGFWSFLM